MHNYYSTSTVTMRMCIYITGLTMCSPPGMTNPKMALALIAPKYSFKINQFPHSFSQNYVAITILVKCHSGRIITPIFQPLAPIE